MPLTKVNGWDIYYEIHGEGEPIVLLHNGFSCVKMWEEVFPYLVEAGYQIVMYDRTGHGRSDGGADFEGYYKSDDFRDVSVETMAALMKFIGIDRFDIVGQCEGGAVGVDYTIKYPDQVKTLTTASTQCYSKISMYDFNRQKFPGTFEDLTPSVREKYFYWHGPERAKLFFTICSDYGGCYGKDVFDLRDLLPLIECPSLVMFPDRGYFFEVEQGVDFYRLLQNGELAIFPRCGHNIYEHYPEQYARQVLRFLNK